MDAEAFCDALIEDLVCSLNLDEMVSAAQAAKLRSPTGLRTVRNLGRVSSFHASLFLNRFRVFWPSIAVVHSPIEPISNGAIQFCDTKFDLAAASESRRYEVENSVNKLRENGAHLFLGKVRPDESNSAVYVVTHSAGADQAFVIISGCYAAYRKAISFMSVWHGDCVFANPI